MSSIRTLARHCLSKDQENRGCGECRSSCQSACKTSATVGNQHCEKRTGREGNLEKKQPF